DRWGDVMSRALVQKIADAILYEGYLLYPYRTSALKNRLRWMFGVLYPEAYCRSGTDAFLMQTECLVVGNGQTHLALTVRFLQVVGQEAVERVVAGNQIISDLADESVAVPFSFPAASEPLAGVVMCSVEPLCTDLFKLCIRIANQSFLPKDVDRDQALAQSLVSTHTILGVQDGEFVSLLEPPQEQGEFVARCRNVGTWPVLAGIPGQRNWMLSSPILLYDYPRVASESPGDLFDATEIDELLTLRIRTMTDAEKR